jgi:hypothetical protein
VATLRERFDNAERKLAENGARWSAAFEAMAAQLEEGFVNRRPVRGAGVSADWRGTLGLWRRRPGPNRQGAASNGF